MCLFHISHPTPNQPLLLIIISCEILWIQVKFDLDCKVAKRNLVKFHFLFIQTTNTLWIRQITTQVLLLLLLLFPPGSNELHNLQHAALRLAQWEHRFSQRSPHISQGKWLLGSDSEKLLIDLILLHSGVISFSLNLIQCLADEDTVCQKFFNFIFWGFV